MKTNRSILALAAVLAVGGVWLAGSAWRNLSLPRSSLESGDPASPGATRPGQGGALSEVQVGIGAEMPTGTPQPHPMLRPPEPNRRFMDFTPEQRVEFARRGHGPGG